MALISNLFIISLVNRICIVLYAIKNSNFDFVVKVYKKINLNFAKVPFVVPFAL